MQRLRDVVTGERPHTDLPTQLSEPSAASNAAHAVAWHMSLPPANVGKFNDGMAALVGCPNDHQSQAQRKFPMQAQDLQGPLELVAETPQNHRLCRSSQPQFDFLWVGRLVFVTPQHEPSRSPTPRQNIAELHRLLTSTGC